MMVKEDSCPRVEGPDSTARLLRPASRKRRPIPIALAIPTTAKRPVAAEADKRVVSAVTAVTAAAPVPVVVVVCKIRGRVAKAGEAKAKARMRTLYILKF